MDTVISNSEIYHPETIQDSPFPVQEGYAEFGATQQTTKGEFGSQKIPSQPFPSRKVAFEVLSNALNTKSRKILAEFQFTQSGALQIGKYENGISGEIKISPSGIVARDSAGLTTFALDGETGDATFKGSLQAGSIITGLITVGNNNIIIDGEAQQIIINDGTHDRVLIGYQLDGF